MERGRVKHEISIQIKMYLVEMNRKGHPIKMVSLRKEGFTSPWKPGLCGFNSVFSFNQQSPIHPRHPARQWLKGQK